jgi:hypothetical protein
MKVDSFIVTLLLWLWTMQKCDCFCGIILRNHDVARRPINRSSHRIPAASTTTRLSQMQHSLQPSNKSHHHHGCLASTSTANVDDDSSSALVVKGDELDDRIRFEFKIGSHGLYGEDGVRFLYPGLAAVLKYPPDAQEAWINGIVSARDHFAHDHNLPTISQRRQYHSRKDEVPVGLKDVIRDEFRIGSHGLYGEDGVRFMYPGLAAVLDYPPHAQEAWILDVAAARDHYALDHDLPTPRHLQVTASRPEAIFSTTTRRRSIATVQKRGLTTFQRFQKIFNSASSGSKKDDGGWTIRQRMAKMGLSVAISYGFVSNLTGCSSIVLTWYIFSKKVSSNKSRFACNLFLLYFFDLITSFWTMVLHSRSLDFTIS